MKFINLKILVLFVLSYSLTLVALTPLSWLQPLIEPQLASMGVRIESLNGSVWQGQGQFRERQLGTVQLDWDVQFGGLFTGKLPISVNIERPDLSLSGVVAVTPGGYQVTGLSGYLDEGLFAPIARQYRAELQGRLQLNEVTVSMGWGRTLKGASGTATWSGGPVSFPMGRSTQRIEVPTLYGTLTDNDLGWAFNVTDVNQQVLVETQLQQDGLGEVRVKRSMAEALRLNVPGSASTIFEISQQVF